MPTSVLSSSPREAATSLVSHRVSFLTCAGDNRSSGSTKRDIGGLTRLRSRATIEGTPRWPSVGAGRDCRPGVRAGRTSTLAPAGSDAGGARLAGGAQNESARNGASARFDRERAQGSPGPRGADRRRSRARGDVIECRSGDGARTAGRRPRRPRRGVHALHLVERIVHEAACPAIALIHAPDPAARRGVQAWRLRLHHGCRRQGLAELDGHHAARFTEYHDLEGAFGRRAVTERAKGILMERH